MPTGNTSLLGLALPVEGELSGTWGDVVNDSITSLVDSAVAGTTTLSADSDVTLTDTALATNQARQAIIRWTASNGATTRNITAPARSKPYIVINAGTGSIVLRGAGPTAGVTIVAGERCLVAWSGSDFVKIGGTSGSGTFTDLTVTGNTTLGDAAGDTVTINGATTFANVSPTITPGTANGVAYLNGSKVLTTGSALTFDGTTLTANTLNLTNALGTAFGGTGLTSFASGGIVYASSGSVLTTNSALSYNGSTLGVSDGSVTAGNSAVVLTGRFSSSFPSSGAGYFQLRTNNGDGTNGGLDIFTLSSGTLRQSYRIWDASDSTGFQAWNVIGSEQMRLTSTGLGIGTSSPSTKLHLYTGAAATTFTIDSGTSGTAIAYSLAGVAKYTAEYVSGSDFYSIGRSGVAYDLILKSGNLGLGVTPSAWGFRTALQIGSGGSLAAFNGGASFASNIEISGNSFLNASASRRYIANDFATLYRQEGGIHSWLTAPSGTAGNAISFTQAMTLTAAGDLGVGTTSPSARLDVQQDTDTIIQRLMNTRTTGNSVCSSRIYGNNGATQFQIDVDGLGSVFGAGALLGMNSNHFLAFKTNNTERARITSGGFFGLGTNNPQAMFDLAGDYKEGVVTANTGTAYTINTATGTLQILTLTGNCTFTFPTAIAGESFTLLLRQDGTGSRTVTWPAAVRWPGGTAPTITATANQTDKYVFTSDGTRWYGSNAGQAYAA